MSSEKSYLELMAELNDRQTYKGSNTLLLYYLGDRRYYGNARPPYSYYLGFKKDMDLLPLDIVSETGPMCTLIHTDDSERRRSMLYSIISQMLCVHDKNSLNIHIIESTIGLQIFQQCDLVKTMTNSMAKEEGGSFLDKAADTLQKIADREESDSPPVDIIVTDNISLLLVDQRCREIINRIIGRKSRYGVRILATDDPSIGMVDGDIFSRSNNIFLKMSEEPSMNLSGGPRFSMLDDSQIGLLVPGSSKIKLAREIESLQEELPFIIKNSIKREHDPDHEMR